MDIRYTVVENESCQQFEYDVMAKLKEGWVCQGGVDRIKLGDSGFTSYAQAMTFTPAHP